MNSRRLIAAPEAQEEASYPPKPARWKGLAMSALGQKRTFAVQNAMSALPPKADMCSALGDVRLVPIADDVAKLLDHLVGTIKQRRRHSKPERLGGLQVNH
jgi:hypothetical protein